MIRKTPSGYTVTSESGKRLARTNLSLGQAKRRLEQIEYFKNKKK